ncbi:MAG: hypothetical protein ACJARV_000052 [Candidatus Pseudothioglobus sp.]|jgi:hypothetical protein
MTINVGDWVGEQTATQGTGSVTLLGPLQGYAGFSTVGDGQYWYTIVNGLNKEAGSCTIVGNLMLRTTVSSTLVNTQFTLGGTAMNLSGTSQVYITFNRASYEALETAASALSTNARFQLDAALFPNQVATPTYPIILLATGQSIMTGVGPFDTVINPGTNSKVFTWSPGNGGTVDIASASASVASCSFVNLDMNGASVTHTNSSSPAINGGITVSPLCGGAGNMGWSWADQIQKMTGRDVYLIMISGSGNPISSWSTDGIYGSNSGAVANFLRYHVNAAIAAIPGANPNKQFDAVYWSQGYSDVRGELLNQGQSGLLWAQKLLFIKEIWFTGTLSKFERPATEAGLSWCNHYTKWVIMDLPMGPRRPKAWTGSGSAATLMGSLTSLVSYPNHGAVDGVHIDGSVTYQLGVQAANSMIQSDNAKGINSGISLHRPTVASFGSNGYTRVADGTAASSLTNGEFCLSTGGAASATKFYIHKFNSAGDDFPLYKTQAWTLLDFSKVGDEAATVSTLLLPATNINGIYWATSAVYEITVDQAPVGPTNPKSWAPKVLPNGTVLNPILVGDVCNIATPEKTYQISDYDSPVKIEADSDFSMKSPGRLIWGPYKQPNNFLSGQPDPNYIPEVTIGSDASAAPSGGILLKKPYLPSQGPAGGPNSGIVAPWSKWAGGEIRTPRLITSFDETFRPGFDSPIVIKKDNTERIVQFPEDTDPSSGYDVNTGAPHIIMGDIDPCIEFTDTTEGTIQPDAGPTPFWPYGFYRARIGFVTAAGGSTLGGFVPSTARGDMTYAANGHSFYVFGSWLLPSLAVKRLHLTTAGATITGGLTVTTNIGCSGLAGSGTRAVYSLANGVLTNSSSDVTLKNILPDSVPGLSAVLEMNPIKYTWKDQDIRGDQIEIGFSAQEIQVLVPEVVGINYDYDEETNDKTETLSIDYPKLVAVLVNSIKELNSRISALEAI